jgi:hypothetical protein
METNLTTKLDAAIAYLRERKIYITEFPFVPTNVAKTDVSATMRRYEIQVLGLNNVKKARR